MNFCSKQGSCRGRRLLCHSLRCWSVRLSILSRVMTNNFFFFFLLLGCYGHDTVDKIGDQYDHSIFQFPCNSFVAVGSTFPCRRMWLDRRLFWLLTKSITGFIPVGPDKPNQYCFIVQLVFSLNWFSF